MRGGDYESGMWGMRVVAGNCGLQPQHSSAIREIKPILSFNSSTPFLNPQPFKPSPSTINPLTFNSLTFK